MPVRTLLIATLCLAAACGSPDDPAGTDAGPDGGERFDARPLPTEHPYISFAHLDGVSMSSAAYTRFEDFVNAAVDNQPGYGYEPSMAVALFYLTGDDQYIDHAIEAVDASVTEAEQASAAGNRPEVSNDSYLYVGEHLHNLALAYDYGFERLTAEQRERWEAYAEQALFNVWNPDDARWGDTAHPWSGWSIDNPGNNYHFSFLRATMYWAIATQSEAWLDFLRDDKLPALSAYWAAIDGGGSREGTAYGTAQRTLFELARVWRDSRGQDIDGVVSHARGTMDYWVNATVPTLDYFAPIGDQARVSMPVMYDYQEHLVLEAAYLHPGTAEAERAGWWLDNNSVGPMESGFNAIHDLLPRPATATIPTETVYHAPGVGNLFARSGWAADDVWLAVVAGPYDESHAAQEQGGFTIYLDGWLAVTENVWSHSGIQQGVDTRNVVRFEYQGATIGQNNGVSQMTYDDSGNALAIDADLAAAYANTDRVTAWTRHLEMTDTTLRVRDDFTVGAGVTASWRVNVPVQPVIDGNSVVAGALRITPVAPASPSISIIDWTEVDGDYDSGYAVELGGGATAYEVELSWQ